MKVHRKIWVEHYGDIPVDDNGRTFEIHHINGNNTDNRIENLTCVSIEEHFNIHYEQGDFLAACSIAARMLRNDNELSKQGGQEAFARKLGFHGLSPEQRLLNNSKGGKANKGLRWYNNGIINKKFGTPPDLSIWTPGKLPCGSGISVGTLLGTFWNNGSVNIRAIECPGIDWVKGKLLTEEQRTRRSEIAHRPMRTESKLKLSQKMKGRPKEVVQCPHCGKQGGKAIMIRHHFDNCRQRDIM